MKKLVKVLAVVLAIATLTACLCFTLTACNKTEASKVKYIDKELTAESYAYLLKKGDTETKAVIDELIADLKGDGYKLGDVTYTLEGIINSFFNGTSTFEYTNPASKDGCLVVATNAYFPPFEYYVGEKLSGVDMQIAALLANKMGKTLYILDEEFDSVFTSVSTGEALLGMAGITVNETRLKSYDFSTEYYESAQVIMVKEGDTTFDACKTAADIEAILATKDKNYVIGTQKGTTGYMYSAGDVDFGYDGFANLTTTSYSNGALAAKDLSNGKVNAVIIDKQPAIMITKNVNATL